MSVYSMFEIINLQNQDLISFHTMLFRETWVAVLEMQAMVFREDSSSCLVWVKEHVIAILETTRALKCCAQVQ